MAIESILLLLEITFLRQTWTDGKQRLNVRRRKGQEASPDTSGSTSEDSCKAFLYGIVAMIMPRSP